jgi:hypothetical protein
VCGFPAEGLTRICTDGADLGKDKYGDSSPFNFAQDQNDSFIWLKWQIYLMEKNYVDTFDRFDGWADCAAGAG